MTIVRTPVVASLPAWMELLMAWIKGRVVDPTGVLQQRRPLADDLADADLPSPVR